MPFINGVFTDLTRLQRTLPTLDALKNDGHKIILISHFGRPHVPEGYDPLAPFVTEELSLKPLVPILEHYNFNVVFASTLEEAKEISLQPGQILLVENLRFYGGEETNNHQFAKELASLGDVYVNDAFSCSHRAHASIDCITNYLPSFGGMSLCEEVEALEKSMDTSKRPLMVCIGGSKISTKIHLIDYWIDHADFLVLGGAMANTFLKAKGIDVGSSLVENNFLNIAKEFIQRAGSRLLLPIDGVTQERSPVDFLQTPLFHDETILDVGPDTLKLIYQSLKDCQNVIWNGPFGVFEKPPYDIGTKTLAEMIVDLTQNTNLRSIVGGGDTLAAMGDLADKVSYASTAGGAFLEWLEGKKLPGLEALEKKC